MRDVTALLALQQISDTTFPSGMFTHSLGLEQLVREGAICTPEDVVRFVTSVLERSVATSDAVATARAVRATQSGELAALRTIDRELFAMKPAAELRKASTDAGRRLLDEVAAHDADPRIAAFLSEVRGGRTSGTHAVSFGVVAAVFGAEAEDAAAMLMQGSANAILQAAMRLLPVSHRDVQGALHRLRPRIAEWARRACEPRRQLESFHPLQDIAAMRHESSAVRMFAS